MLEHRIAVNHEGEQRAVARSRERVHARWRFSREQQRWQHNAGHRRSTQPWPAAVGHGTPLTGRRLRCRPMGPSGVGPGTMAPMPSLPVVGRAAVEAPVAALSVPSRWGRFASRGTEGPFFFRTCAVAESGGEWKVQEILFIFLTGNRR